MSELEERQMYQKQLRKLFLYFIIANVGFILFSIGLTGILGGPITDHPTLAKIVQLSHQLLLYGTPPIILAYVLGENSLTKYQLNTRFKPVWIPLIILIIFSSLAFVSMLSVYNHTIDFPDWMSGFESSAKEAQDQIQETIDKLMVMETIPQLLFNLLVFALVPAVTEELMFRGAVQRLIMKFTGKVHFSVLITSFLFSMLHTQLYSFLPLFFVSVIFGYIFLWTGSLWAPIIAHFVFNGHQIVLQYLYKSGIIDPEKHTGGEVFDPKLMLVYTLISTAIMFLLLKVLYQTSPIAEEDDTPNEYERMD